MSYDIYSQVQMMKAVLGLEDGTVIKGTGFGAESTACGELVFTTQFTGYEEALTDHGSAPSSGYVLSRGCQSRRRGFTP